MNQIDWNIVINCTNLEFIDLFEDKLDKVCPLVKIKNVQNEEQKPWITSTLKKLYEKEE